MTTLPMPDYNFDEPGYARVSVEKAFTIEGGWYLLPMPGSKRRPETAYQIVLIRRYEGAFAVQYEVRFRFGGGAAMDVVFPADTEVWSVPEAEYNRFADNL